MIKFKIFGIYISISFLFVSLLCWFLIYDVDRIFLCYFVSSIFHELAHIMALSNFSVKIKQISLKVFGFSIKRIQQLPFLKEIVVLFSGCFSNFILILIFMLSKNKTAILVNLIILILNLLPIEFLDGGQILKLFLDRFLSNEKSFKICKNISILFSLVLFVVFLNIILYYKNFKFIFLLFIYILSFVFEE